MPKPDVPKPDVPKALKVRKPSPINLRVLLFIAVLAGLAAVVAWVWRNAPANEQVPTTDVVVTVDPSRTPSTLTLETSAADTVTTTAGAAPVVPSTASAATDALSTTTGAPQSSVSVAPPITDPFAEPTQAPTTTAKKSSTTKKRK